MSKFLSMIGIKKYLIVNIALILSLTSCKDQNKELLLAGDDYLIFGHFFGLCMGEECVEIFKLNENSLYEDRKDIYGGDGPYDFIKLDNELFDKARDLPSHIPDKLLKKNSTIFGCPDCADQGGLFVKLVRNGKEHFYKIDYQKSEVPDYLHPFIDKLDETIGLINNQ